MAEEINKKEEKKSFSLKTWIRLLKHLSKFKTLIYFLCALTASLVVFDIIFPLIQAHIIDNYIEKNTSDGVILFGIIYAALASVQSFVIILYFRYCIKLEMRLSQSLRNDIFSKFQSLPLAYFNDKPVGYLVAKTMSDTERISSTIAWGIIDIGWSMLYICTAFIPMFILNYKVALAVLVIVPIALLLSVLFERRLLKHNREIRHLNSAVSGALNEGITGAKTVISLNVEQNMSDKFSGLTDKMYKRTLKYNRLNAVYSALLVFLGSFITAAVLVLGGHSVILGMSIGEFSALFNYTAVLVYPIMNLAQSITNLVANQANVERVNSILDLKSITDTEAVIEKYGTVFDPKINNYEPIEGDIEFKNVSFKYEDDGRYILKNFNLKIPKGTSLALVGETGAGKTTIVNLLCRFYEPTEGSILIDGVEYRERSVHWLSSSLGYVLQTPHLFSGTIKSNIKYADLNGSDERMIEAARLVSADKVVEKLENGYDSQIGECGDSLSTGEKQLITFARAVYADPKIIILDEATSSIDAETEQMIQNAITKILKNRTSLTIAHRLSTIKNADNIVLIDDGGILEQGSHAQLMELSGAYRDLYKKMIESENTKY